MAGHSTYREHDGATDGKIESGEADSAVHAVAAGGAGHDGQTILARPSPSTVHEETRDPAVRPAVAAAGRAASRTVKVERQRQTVRRNLQVRGRGPPRRWHAVDRRRAGTGPVPRLSHRRSQGFGHTAGSRSISGSGSTPSASTMRT